MATELSKTQIDKLGERLKKGEISEADLRLLDEYRRSFSEAFESTIGAIKAEVGLEPTGRPAKSTTSISDKLLRESIRLTQIQDIAGCRLIVSELVEQDRVMELLKRLFDNAIVVDRRKHPSHGYRAVHVIVGHRGKSVEIQVRTSLQHVWAELSEKLSDVIDPAIKYGRGNEELSKVLLESSVMIAQEEASEAQLASLEGRVSGMLARGSLDQNTQQELIDLQDEIVEAKKNQETVRDQKIKRLRSVIDQVPKIGGGNAISD